MRQFLNKRVDIQRPSVSQGNNLGFSSSPVNAYSDLPASIQPARSFVMKFYAQRQLRVTQTIYVSAGLSVLRGDSVTDGTLTYQVIGVRDLAGRGRVIALDVDLWL